MSKIIESVAPFLQTFFAAYLDTALWTSFDESGQTMDKNYSIDQIAPDALEVMKADCLSFYTTNELEQLPESFQKQAGHDFWLTRNGHGAGFWDGDWEEPTATMLTESSHSFGESTLHVSTDNLIYCYPDKAHLSVPVTTD